MSNLSFLDAVEGVREACVVAKARIQHEIDYTKNQLHDKYGVLMEPGFVGTSTEAEQSEYEIGYKYFFRRLVVLDKIMADLVKTEAKMATGQLHFKGILNYCRFGYCSK